MDIFGDPKQEADFRIWCDNHRQGFVLNCPGRKATPHIATCQHLTLFGPDYKGSLTNAPKICDDELESLGIWAMQNRRKLTPCTRKKCLPLFEKLATSPIDVERQDLNDEMIEQAIIEGRLRIGIIPTSSEKAQKQQRRGQELLRQMTLMNYDSMCALCEVNDPSLLVASHIVGWAESPEARGVLSNVICLCRFHDALFEQGYWSLADDFTVLRKVPRGSRTIAFLLDSSLQFRKPHDHLPAPGFLHHHRLHFGLDSSVDNA